jgi:hypothetical protein
MRMPAARLKGSTGQAPNNRCDIADTGNARPALRRSTDGSSAGLPYFASSRTI